MSPARVHGVSPVVAATAGRATTRSARSRPTAPAVRARGPKASAILAVVLGLAGLPDAMHPVAARVSLAGARFLAGCRLIPSAAAAEGQASGIEGATWRLSHLTGLEDEQLAAVRGGVTLRLEGGRLQAFGGCNRMAGAYSLAADRLRIGPLAGTMMACPQAQMQVENAFRTALAGDFAATVEDGRLRLAQGSVTLTFVAEPPPRVDGVTWTVTGYNNGRQAVVSPLAGTTLTLSFDGGSVVGQAGCNGFRATAVIGDGRLDIGPIAATRKTCPGEGVMEQERQFLAALESAKTWTIERGMLDVHRADGERVLTASVSGEAPE